MLVESPCRQSGDRDVWISESPLERRPESLATPLSPEEYTSLVVHAAVEAEND